MQHTMGHAELRACRHPLGFAKVFNVSARFVLRPYCGKGGGSPGTCENLIIANVATLLQQDEEKKRQE